jgi:hypothetical protein
MGEVNLNELQAELARLREENAQLKKVVKRPPRVRRTPKNQIAVLVDGRRFPITMDWQQWKQLLTDADRKNAIRALCEQMEAEGIEPTHLREEEDKDEE